MTAIILNHPTRFSGDARIRLANMRLMNAMAAVQENMATFVRDRDWSGEMDRIFQEACRAEEASVRLLSEAKHD